MASQRVSDGPYTRKRSSEEQRERYVMVLKNWLPFFPPVGEAFELAIRGDVGSATVDAVACICQGPEKPHEHYSIRLPEGAEGREVTIRKAGAGRYELEAS